MQRRYSWPPDVSALDALYDYTWQRHLGEKSCDKCIVYETINTYYEMYYIRKGRKMIDDFRL